MDRRYTSLSISTALSSDILGKLGIVGVTKRRMRQLDFSSQCIDSVIFSSMSIFEVVGLEYESMDRCFKGRQPLLYRTA